MKSKWYERQDCKTSLPSPCACLDVKGLQNDKNLKFKKIQINFMNFKMNFKTEERLTHGL